MKKAAKVEYGIEIVKPWSQAMYDHNDAVADQVREDISTMWSEALQRFEESIELDEEGEDVDIMSMDWECASEEMIEIQTAITCYGFGFGYTIESVSERVEVELLDAPYFRLKDMAEELGLELEKGFVGF